MQQPIQQSSLTAHFKPAVKGFTTLTQAIFHMPHNQVSGDGIVSWCNFASVH